MSAATQTSNPPTGLDAVAAITAGTLGKAPETLAALGEHNKRVWHDSLVPPALLELIRLRNARTVNCVTCKAVRYDRAREDGFVESKADMVTASYRESALSPREKGAIALADCYLGFPAGVSAADAADIAREFSPEEVRSMLLAVMCFNFTSRAAVSSGAMPEDDLPLIELKI